MEFTIGLREHFSMPFIFAQYAAVGNFFNVFNPKSREPTRVDNEARLFPEWDTSKNILTLFAL